MDHNVVKDEKGTLRLVLVAVIVASLVIMISVMMM